ncbi:unnamed protein product [Ostreobium quekettii]|uniref:Uncharacterized protein n=1 Tax=Ostreobium quekettii TaxID=121088 RepID=A0A8S1IX95_9CHLO|nr:unnamed protein product [Ostreobium quekettii]
MAGMQDLVADAREILCDHGVVNLVEKNILDSEELGMVTELFSPTRPMPLQPMLPGSAEKSPITPPTHGASGLGARVQVTNVSTPSAGNQPLREVVSPGPSMSPSGSVGPEQGAAISRPEMAPMDQTLSRLQGYRNTHPGQLAPLPAGNHRHISRPSHGACAHTHVQSSPPVAVQQQGDGGGLSHMPAAAGPQGASIKGVAPHQGQSAAILSSHMQAAGVSLGQTSTASAQSYLQAVQYGAGGEAYSVGTNGRLPEGMGGEVGQKALSAPAMVSGDVGQKQLQTQLQSSLQALQNQAEARLAHQQSDYQALLATQQKQQQGGAHGTYSGQGPEGAQGLILAQPSVLPGQGSTTAQSRTAGASNGMHQTSTGDASYSRAAVPAHQLHSASHEAGIAPGGSSSAPDRNGNASHSKQDAALNAALETLRYSLNEDGNLSSATFEKIVQELSGIESLQSMLLFRPNKKKGKGGRQPAKDPRLDPNMDPRKAKRIVANR